MTQKRIILPSIYQDHMILQRDKPLRIRARVSDVIASVTVELSDMARKVPALARRDEVPEPDLYPAKRVTVKAENGTISCDFPAQPAGRDKALRFYVNGEHQAELAFTDVCFGDIWLACGQSNMEYFLRYDAHFNDIKKEEFNPDIHMYNVPRIAFEGQEKTKDLSDSGHWFLQGDAAWGSFSAPGYCFARKIHEQYRIPVGVIGCNWGGTPACAWVAPEYLQAPLDVYLEEYRKEVEAWDPEKLKEASLAANAYENTYQHEIEWRSVMYGLTWEEQERWMQEHAGAPELPMGPWHHYRPCGLYETMIRTIAPFSVKGVLWYQGESDADHASLYGDMMKALIKCFRDTWQDPKLPFLYVQLAPFARWLDCTGDHYEEVREQQDAVSHKVSRAHMISIMDLGDHDDIHPKYKREVGERLALLARGTVYGEPLLCESPELLEVTCRGKKLHLSFENARGGLYLDEHAGEAFAVCSGGEPVAVTGVRPEGEGLTVELACEVAEEGLAVDFAYAPYCEVHIWNQAGLPVKPFRWRASV